MKTTELANHINSICGPETALEIMTAHAKQLESRLDSGADYGSRTAEYRPTGDTQIVDWIIRKVYETGVTGLGSSLMSVKWKTKTNPLTKVQLPYIDRDTIALAMKSDR